VRKGDIRKRKRYHSAKGKMKGVSISKERNNAHQKEKFLNACLKKRKNGKGRKREPGVPDKKNSSTRKPGGGRRSMSQERKQPHHST